MQRPAETYRNLPHKQFARLWCVFQLPAFAVSAGLASVRRANRAERSVSKSELSVPPVHLIHSAKVHVPLCVAHSQRRNSTLSFVCSARVTQRSCPIVVISLLIRLGNRQSINYLRRDWRVLVGPPRGFCSDHLDRRAISPTLSEV